MENKNIAKTDLVSWVKDKWAHSPLFSTLMALLVMVLVQSVVMTNLAGSFVGMFGKMGMAWLNILRNNTYAGVIALGMCFVIISGGIDLSVGSMLCALGAMLMYMLDETAGPLAAMGITGAPAYKVTDYAARYLRGETTLPMRRHRVMKVEATDGVWLCDVGIGEVCQREPVAMVVGLEQSQYGETYKLEQEEGLGWVLWDLYKGQWRKFYSFTEEVQLEVDYIAPNFYCEKHPDSPFNKDEMFAVKTAQGRKTLDGHIYKEFKNGEVFVKELTDAEMPEAYAVFGLKY